MTLRPNYNEKYSYIFENILVIMISFQGNQLQIFSKSFHSKNKTYSILNFILLMFEK